MDLQKAKTECHDALLTIEEAAALLKVSKSWLYERTRKGAILHLKLGKYLRFPAHDLLVWVAAQRRPVREDPLALFHGNSQPASGLNDFVSIALSK
jgi:excisionase family DNA binding protein